MSDWNSIAWEREMGPSELELEIFKEQKETILALVIAAGGQVHLSVEDMRQISNFFLITHKDSDGGTLLTALSNCVKCQDCDGLGGIAIAGPDKSHPALICPSCRGTGIKKKVKCRQCNGMGGVAVTTAGKPNPGLVCPVCNGEGESNA